MSLVWLYCNSTILWTVFVAHVVPFALCLLRLCLKWKTDLSISNVSFNRLMLDPE